MANIIVVAIIAIIVALDIRYIYKQKKSGKACIGCSGGCSGGCSCSKTGYNKK
ncbi:FeoB-associated Cys-rich membrane protein [Butyrivibrio sp. NC3005]|uniref:FeoB-associated Cys-rich membrane protein n=1 Tax=Butyrivibrio sp. NC3005 TaxID=1280685 RepID=UPI0003FE1916|nr:FeoB-associated Cys-rich membrane protein [Butyrivibrio sp. NC3005]